MARLVLVSLLACGCDQVFDVHRDPPAADGPLGTIVYQQSQSATFNVVPSATLTFTQPVVSGDLVIVVVGTYHGDFQKVTDSAGNSYVAADSPVSTVAGSRVHVLYAANVVTASPFTVTAAALPSADNELTLAIHAYRGAARDPLDQHQTQIGDDAMPTTAAVTPAVDGELFFGAVSHDATLVTSPGEGYQLRELPSDSDVSVPLATEDRIGGPQRNAATFTLSAPASWAAWLVTFKPSAL